MATLVGWFVLVMGQTFANAQTNFQRILSFGPVAQLGSSPRAALMEGSDGMLYGTTYAGGSNNIGTVFRIAKDGSGFGVLHSLSEGSYPYA
ncbi:MAG TPA: choice-of-anchor tandem repeat GloVer-containing protein, partial [Verrucomicrobiae bacterium]|nr:choice-of-anchor tandem repeat GloVer-containing protein [Verrucomicrobiae bacterium]